MKAVRDTQLSTTEELANVVEHFSENVPANVVCNCQLLEKGPSYLQCITIENQQSPVYVCCIENLQRANENSLIKI